MIQRAGKLWHSRFWKKPCRAVQSRASKTGSHTRRKQYFQHKTCSVLFFISESRLNWILPPRKGYKQLYLQGQPRCDDILHCKSPNLYVENPSILFHNDILCQNLHSMLVSTHTFTQWLALLLLLLLLWRRRQILLISCRKLNSLHSFYTQCTQVVLNMHAHTQAWSYGQLSEWWVRCLAQGHLGSGHNMYCHFSSYRTIFHTWSDRDLNQGPSDSQPKSLLPQEPSN